MLKTTFAAAAMGAALLVAGSALAGDAVCFNSDEGEYDCWFEPAGGGSFTISADGYTTYYVDVSEPGVAWVNATFPGGNRWGRVARSVLSRAGTARMLAQSGYLARSLRVVAVRR